MVADLAGFRQIFPGKPYGRFINLSPDNPERDRWLLAFSYWQIPASHFFDSAFFSKT
jgi:hypothetical protein